jgi:hypothetical protein
MKVFNDDDEAFVVDDERFLMDDAVDVVDIVLEVACEVDGCEKTGDDAAGPRDDDDVGA